MHNPLMDIKNTNAYKYTYNFLLMHYCWYETDVRHSIFEFSKKERQLLKNLFRAGRIFRHIRVYARVRNI